jgi:hypothetical protein
MRRFPKSSVYRHSHSRSSQSTRALCPKICFAARKNRRSIMRLGMHPSPLALTGTDTPCRPDIWGPLETRGHEPAEKDGTPGAGRHWRAGPRTMNALFSEATELSGRLSSPRTGPRMSPRLPWRACGALQTDPMTRRRMCSLSGLAWRYCSGSTVCGAGRRGDRPQCLYWSYGGFDRPAEARGLRPPRKQPTSPAR